MQKILIINGPNLNLLSLRNKDIYGNNSLEDIKNNCQKIAQANNLEITFEQKNSEGDIVDLIQNAIDKFDIIIINAAAYTHTSIAIRDALEIFNGKKIELHLSNIYKREDFRHKSLISDISDGIIAGFGAKGYELALFSVIK
ncbi:type II 3-dehydroquinate dehydratase [Rickettsiales bacterium]|nr:type II 3-dehydroquinate dehydratase [Rickettsiales bacterium]